MNGASPATACFVEALVAGEVVRAFVPPHHLDDVAETANEAFDAAKRIVDLFKADRERITVGSAPADSGLRLHDYLQQRPFLTVGQLVEQTGLTTPTINVALADLERLGLVEEMTGRRRGRSRVVAYHGYLALRSEGTRPLPIAG